MAARLEQLSQQLYFALMYTPDFMNFKPTRIACWAAHPKDAHIKREKNFDWCIRTIQGVIPRNFIERLDFADGQPVFADPENHPFFSPNDADSFKTGKFGPGPTSYEPKAGDLTPEELHQLIVDMDYLKPLVDNPDLGHIYLATTWSNSAGPRESNHVVQITQADYQEWICTHMSGRETRFVIDFPRR